MAGRNKSDVSSSPGTDPVLNLLADLGRDKPKIPDKLHIEHARKRYNEMVEELELHRKRLVNGKQGSSALEQGSKSQETLQKLRDENQKLSAELNSVKLRLSEVMGDKIVANNPSITDLSDPYRPIALAEKFKQVYDDEWVNAFEDLEKFNITEPKRLEFLANIIKSADTFCGAALLQMTGRIGDLALDDISRAKIRIKSGIVVADTKAESSECDIKNSTRLIKRYVKELCHLSVRGLIELYYKISLKQTLSQLNINSNPRGINCYVEKIVEYVWRMQLTDPPMVLKWQESGSDVSKDISSFYTKIGPKVKQPIWPAILLHEGGQVVCKGIVDVE